MSFQESKLFVALDLDDAREAEAIADSLSKSGVGFKLGPRLLMREGAALVKRVAQHGPVFVDNKYFDIPSTMESAIRATFEAGASVATVHAMAGPEALGRLAKIESELAVERAFRILAVTVLTSFSPQTLPFRYRDQDIANLVEGLAKDAFNVGIHSFVCSPHEAARLRAALPSSHLVTPGVRPVGSDVGDQKRVETPAAAARAGASALVVGRPILEAKDRRAMALSILKEFELAREEVRT